ncbi:uncharacterized protein [Nicotiana sylvestris]|uniref:uncharacterized protein n=1 Tax=Nicotiana sylvestris TaxID=4096 RepID=UPI00388C3652
MGSLAYLTVEKRLLAMDVQALANQFMRFDVLKPSLVIACVVTQSLLLEHIKAHQFDDPHLIVQREMAQWGGAKEFLLCYDGVMRLQGQICVPNADGLRELILEEAHSLRCSIHAGVTKIYCDLKQRYWWRIMKKYIVSYVSRCLNWQQVKYEH